MKERRPYILVFASLGALLAAAGAWSALRQPDPYSSFTSHLMVLLGVPFLAMAAGIATGGVAISDSGASSRPTRARDGFWELPAFRSWLAIRNAAVATLALLAVFGFFAFVDFFGKTRSPGALAPLLFLIWLWFLARLAWSVFKRTAVAGRLAEARLFVSRPEPRPGEPFSVRVEQAAAPANARGTPVRALEAALIADETTTRLKAGKTRSATKQVYRQLVVLGQDLRARPDAPAVGEGTFDVPDRVGAGEGWVRWRVEVRTRLAGPDYTTRFPIPMADDEEE